jgi:hypothetical protein
MTEADRSPAGLPAAFEEAFGRLQLLVAEACREEAHWSRSVARAIVAVLDFAANEPDAARAVSTDALSYGPYGAYLHRKLIEYFAASLAACSERGRRQGLPEIVEEALVAGVAELVAVHLRGGRQDELPGIASQVIELTLLPYLGLEQARRVAVEVVSGG